MDNHYNKVNSDMSPDQVLNKAKDLTTTILASKVYRQYRKNLHILKEHDEIRQKLNTFRRKRLELEELEDGYEEAEEALREEYKDILLLPVVMNFLTSEDLLNRMLRGVYDRIATDVRVDLSYLDN